MRIFFPHELAQRVTQWERGNDPLTQLTFTDAYDGYGQPQSQLSIAVPRGRDPRVPGAPPSVEPYLATRTLTVYAQPTDPEPYIFDRVASTTTFEINNDDTADVLAFHQQVLDGSISKQTLPIGQTVNYYDGEASLGQPSDWGLPFGQVGSYGALVRSDTLVLTPELLQAGYQSGEAPASSPEEPPYLTRDATADLSEYPQGFRDAVDALPGQAGYTYGAVAPTSPYEEGYFATTERRHYDFHDGSGARGLVTAHLDPLGRATTVEYDPYALLPKRVVDSVGLETRAEYDYRVLQPSLVTDPNDNRTAYAYTPLGLVLGIAVMGKAGQDEGDTREQPGTIFRYDFLAFENCPAGSDQPVFVETIKRTEHRWDLVRDENARRAAGNEAPLTDAEIDAMFPPDEAEEHPERFIRSRQMSDGFGRLLQTRTQAEAEAFGDPVFGAFGNPDPMVGDFGLPIDQSLTVGDAVGRAPAPGDLARVAMSGWQTYDNKGRVVEKYEPFFADGWEYAQPSGSQLGERVTTYYDPRGRVVRTVHPDASEQRIVYGIPGSRAVPDLSNPDVFEPTPWESLYCWTVSSQTM